MTRQRTIKDPVTIEGAGLQTGKKARLTLRGSPANSGINFIRLDLPNKPLLNVRSMPLGEAGTGPGRRTTMAVGELEVQTTEHLLAALSGLGIDNIVMELDNVEVPGLDGSAKGFVDAIKKGRVVEQDAPRKILKVAEAVWCEGQNSFIAVFPDEDFKISFTLSYDNPAIGTQFYSVALNEMEFEANIAPARTFCLEGEARELLRLGFGRGANTGNTLVIGRSGPAKNAYRFPNEPVRHKVLDLIGDLYLLGMPIKGHVVALKSGHRLNVELVKKLKTQSSKLKTTT